MAARTLYGSSDVVSTMPRTHPWARSSRTSAMPDPSGSPASAMQRSATPAAARTRASATVETSSTCRAPSARKVYATDSRRAGVATTTRAAKRPGRGTGTPVRSITVVTQTSMLGAPSVDDDVPGGSAARGRRLSRSAGSRQRDGGAAEYGGDPRARPPGGGSALAGERRDAVRQRREPAHGAQQHRPRDEVVPEVVQRGPGGTDLELDRGRLGRECPVALGDDAG